MIGIQKVSSTVLIYGWSALEVVQVGNSLQNLYYMYVERQIKLALESLSID
jgi:hypothetical protein